jgi:hypothetical protein
MVSWKEGSTREYEMADKPWKSEERQVARILGRRRYRASSAGHPGGGSNERG